MSHSHASSPSSLEHRHGKGDHVPTEPPSIVGDLVVALREELIYLVPLLLAPIFDEFNELKTSQAKFINSILKTVLFKPAFNALSPESYASGRGYATGNGAGISSRSGGPFSPGTPSAETGHNGDRKPRAIEYLESGSPSRTDFAKRVAECSNVSPTAATVSSADEGLHLTSEWTELGADLVKAPKGMAMGSRDLQSTPLQTTPFSPAQSAGKQVLFTPGRRLDGEGSKSNRTQGDSIESMPATAVGSSRDGEASQSTLVQPDSGERASVALASSMVCSEPWPSVGVQTALEDDSVEAVAAAGAAVSTTPVAAASPGVPRIKLAGLRAAPERDTERFNLPEPPLALSARAWLPYSLRTHTHINSARECGYSQLTETNDDPVVSKEGYTQLMESNREEHEEDEHDEHDWHSEGIEIRDPEGAKRLSEEIEGLEAEEAHARQYLDDLERLFEKRAQPYKDDIARLHEELEEKHEHLEEARMPLVHEPPPPGPVCLEFVHSDWFGALCNVLVLLNLLSMAVQPQLKEYAHVFKILDNVFLTWYVFELGSKSIYYQKDFMIGKVSVVWWNWLDTGIVVGGILDQWLMPLILASNGGHKSINTSALRVLRLLRLFRLLRFLKIIKAFLKSDLAWTNGPNFELFMAGIIAFNSIVMALELDIPWAGWNYVENFLLIVYTFELSLRLKHSGWHFFVDCNNIVWHYLDFIMVAGGILDLWLVPLIHALQSMLGGHVDHQGGGSIGQVLRLLKIMRILRVLRLVKLLQMIKPLYTLLLGVMESVRAMQWVIVLTFLTIYACAIVFTNLVGKGLMSNGHVTDDESLYFGSVSKSMFSLFKLMNGDTSVVEPITNSGMGQLMFISFMVVSNWSILAILTSVVSDNMISSSQRHNEEVEAKEKELDHEDKIRRLSKLFEEIDTSGNKRISTEEWNKMMEDEAYNHEICDATGLDPEDLHDYFECLAEDVNAVVQKETEKEMDYSTFINMLKHEGTAADQRSILRVMSQLRAVENRVNEIAKGPRKERRFSTFPGIVVTSETSAGLTEASI